MLYNVSIYSNKINHGNELTFIGIDTFSAAEATNKALQMAYIDETMNIEKWIALHSKSFAYKTCIERNLNEDGNKIYIAVSNCYHRENGELDWKNYYISTVIG